MSIHHPGARLGAVAVLAAMAVAQTTVVTAASAAPTDIEVMNADAIVRFVGMVPVRVLDTRTGSDPYQAGSVHEVPVAATHGIPADAVAVVLNATVDQPAAAGFLTIFPCETDMPVAANLNFIAGRTTANAVTTPLTTGGSAGSVCVYTSATTHVVLDVGGAFSATAGTGLMQALTPTRLLDTRTATQTTAGTPVPGGMVQRVMVAGRGAVASDATSVVLTVTVDAPSAAGFVTAYPCGGATPLASNVNFLAGQTVPNSVTVALGADGDVCLFTNVTTHLVVDLNAAFAPSSTGHLVPTAIARLADTRLTWGPTVGTQVAPGSVLSVVVSGRGSIPADATTVTLNVGVDDATGPGFLTVFPCGTPVPLASNVNHVAGQTVSSSVTVGVGAGGTVCVFSMAATHVIVDVDAVFS